jgi:exopolysaccharide production protein ExoF
MIKSRWRARTALLPALLCVGSTCYPANAQTSYTLQPGDTVQVWMAQAEELRRDVIVGPDGGISLPLIGHMTAEGLTLIELEAALRQRLLPFFTETDLTLMLRPGHEPVIYVVGEVTTPGAYPYRSNMTVLHGVSVSGGLYRAAVLPADQDRSVIVRGQVNDGAQHLREVAARIARLEAELAGRSTIAPGNQALDDPFLAQEQLLLDARARSLKTTESAQEQAEALAQRSKDALQEQIQTVNRRIELSRDRLRSVSTLVAKGGAESSQKNRHEAEIAELEGQISRLNAEMVVLERTRMADVARFEASLQERQTELLAELQAARRDEADTIARLSDSRRILSIYGASAAAHQERERQTLTYTIIRSQNGHPVLIKADETTPLQAYDLVRIEYGADGLGGSSGASAEANPASLSALSAPVFSGASQ